MLLRKCQIKSFYSYFRRKSSLETNFILLIYTFGEVLKRLQGVRKKVVLRKKFLFYQKTIDTVVLW